MEEWGSIPPAERWRVPLTSESMPTMLSELIARLQSHLDLYGDSAIAVTASQEFYDQDDQDETDEVPGGWSTYVAKYDCLIEVVRDTSSRGGGDAVLDITPHRLLKRVTESSSSLKKTIEKTYAKAPRRLILTD